VSVSNSPASGIVTALGAIAALVIAFAHLTPAQAAMAASLATAAGTIVVIITGVMAGKPVSMQALTGATAIILADLALFGIRMDAEERGAVVAAVAVFAGLALHLLHVTVTSAPVTLESGTGARHRDGGSPGPHRPSGLTEEI